MIQLVIISVFMSKVARLKLIAPYLVVEIEAEMKTSM